MAQAAEDAMVELQEHLKDEHGEEEMPDRLREEIKGSIKSESKRRQ